MNGYMRRAFVKAGRLLRRLVVFYIAGLGVPMSIRPLLGEGRIRARDDLTEPLHAASWLGVVFEHRRWTCREVEMRWRAPHHLIVLTEAGRTAATRIRCGDETVYDGRDRAGVISFVPAGVERDGLYRDADLTYSALWLDPSLDLPEFGRLAQLPILANRSDPVVATLLSTLRAEMASGCTPQSAYIEHAVAILALRLAALHGVVPRPARHGVLGRRTLARVEDYVAAHLVDDISLSVLAAVAGVGADSFARRFKATTGLAPYAYVLEKRIGRAEDLLRATDLSLASIAVQLGFSSQSHFTTTFRRLRGTTPRAWRANVPES